MKIYNPFKKEVYASSFTLDDIRGRDVYIRVDNHKDIENIFIKDEELSGYDRISSNINCGIFVIKDENIGKRIFDIIKHLKEHKVVIKTQDASFKITKIIMNWEKDQILGFVVVYKSKEIYRKVRNSKCEENWNFSNISSLKIIKELVSFIASLHKAGYYFSSDDFDVTICNSICGVLANMHRGGNIEDSRGCIIKLIHYMLSNIEGMENEYPNLKDLKFIDSKDIKYSIHLFFMFYNYYCKNKLPENIIEVIDKSINEKKHYKYKKFISLADELDKESMDLIIKENMPCELEILQQENIDNSITDCLVKNKKYIEDMVGIKIKHFIFNTNGMIMAIIYDNTNRLIRNYNFYSQYSLIEIYMKRLHNFIFNNVLKSNISFEDKNDKYLDLEEYVGINEKQFFQFKNLNTLIKLLKLPVDAIEKSYMSLFMKKYLKFITDKYGEIRSKEEFFKLNEIKALSPETAVWFVNGALNNLDSDFKNIKIPNFNAFEDFFESTKKYREYAYYGKYNFNPFEVNIVFKSELPKVYGINKIVEKFTELNDERVIEKVCSKMSISQVMDIEGKNKEALDKYFEEFYLNDNVVINNISEIICSNNELIHGMYRCLGVIREYKHVYCISDNELMRMNNRDFLNIATNIFSYFDKYSFDLRYISIYSINNMPKYYINVPFEKVMSVDKVGKKTIYAKVVLNSMIKRGYRNKINYNVNFKDRNQLQSIVSSFDSYCQKHDEWYFRYSGCSICSLTLHLFPKEEFANKNVIYEDKYTKHYELDDKYNIKIYNKDAVDINEMEKRIDRIISNGQDFNEEIFKQELFIPEKKLVDITDNKFYRSSI